MSVPGQVPETEVWRYGGTLCVGDPNDGDNSKITRVQERSELVFDAACIFDAFRVARGDWEYLAVLLLHHHGYFDGLGRKKRPGRKKSANTSIALGWLRVRSELDNRPERTISASHACRLAGVSRAVFSRALRNPETSRLSILHQAVGPSDFWLTMIAEARREAELDELSRSDPWLERPEYVARKVSAMHAKLFGMQK